jgi:hypothetical protein
VAGFGFSQKLRDFYGIVSFATMPRYYFIIEVPDHTYNDPDGELLPGDEAAKDYGYCVVRELIEGEFESAGAVLRIRDESGQTIHSIPFWLC